MSFNYNILTSKQKKVYAAIEASIRSNGIPPTVREIGEFLGEKTPGAVQGILNRLEKKGAIKRQAGAARSIQIVPRNVEMYNNPIYIPEIKKITDRNLNDLLDVYNVIKYQPFPQELVETSEPHFIIKCQSDDLSESNISFDDILIVRMDCDLKEGDIALILYDNYSLLRRYSGVDPEKNLLVFKSDSGVINKELFDLSEISIIGKVIGKYCKL